MSIPLGPCLPHCYVTAPATVFFARLAFVYIIASVGYLVLTRKIGTPFYDSLTEEQRAIKRESVKVREKAFYTAALIGIIMIVLWRPFSKV